MVTIELLHELFEYRNGKLFWLKPFNSKSRIKIGEEAGNDTSHGYRKIVINYKNYATHQLIFMMFHAYIPKEIDHINMVRNDNRIENLRSVTRSINIKNQKKYICIETGKVGIKSTFVNKWFDCLPTMVQI